ncbi:MAG: hypothetical protein LJE70_12490 [Chromatiaceae bacterium]|nr:hypothetical protein [Chromatiaceae bacterium]
MGELYTRLFQDATLYNAWRDVRSNALTSQWPSISQQAEAIDRDPLSFIHDVRTDLKSGGFRFDAKFGYTKRKAGGSRRGIVVASLRDRLVQRALLNILQADDPQIRKSLGVIPEILTRPTNVAGVSGRSIAHGVWMVRNEIRNGATYFICSDVKSFFPRIPRGEVLAILRENIPDQDFCDLFESALETRLSNAQEMESWVDLFPLGTVGVPQGSILSVFCANIALGRFDELLNDGPFRMIRYLDDFVILSDTEQDAERRFQVGLKELRRFGMDAYRPRDGSEKAWAGATTRGLEFLGCRVHADGIGPSRKVRKKLIRDIREIVRDSKREIADALQSGGRRRAEHGYAQTLNVLDKKIRGWGDTFRFCTNRVVFSQLDRDIDAILADYEAWLAKQRRLASIQGRRRLLGVSLLADTRPWRLDDRQDSDRI